MGLIDRIIEDKVVLVDEKDNQVGVEGKTKAHKNGGTLHRAISVFLFNDKGEALIQKRSIRKYHAQGLWANTCCSHPRPGEPASSAAKRRLVEEMGIVCDIDEVFTFTYHAYVGNGMTENEFDHVFFGKYNGEPSTNPKEVDAWRWVSLEDLREEIGEDKERFAPWLVLMLDKVIETYEKEQGQAGGQSAATA